jgi:hypothetical protein
MDVGAPMGLKDGHHRGLKEHRGYGSKDPSDHLNESDVNPYESHVNPYESHVNPYESHVNPCKSL